MTARAPWPSPIPWVRFTLAYGILFTVTVVGSIFWDRIPGTLPIHWNGTGAATGFASKSVLTAFAGVWIGLSVITVLLVAALLWSRRLAGSRDREGVAADFASLERWANNGTFASAALVLSVATSLLCVLSWTSGVPAAVIVLATIAMLAALLITVLGYRLALREGMARLPEPPRRSLGEGSQLAGDSIYAHRHDSAIVVARDTEYGWALNLGRPSVIACVLGYFSLLLIPTVVALVVIL